MEAIPQILLIDDEFSIAETVIAYATREHIEVTYAADGETGLHTFDTREFDLVLLDWMLPGISGPEILKRIREKSTIPVIMLSARDDESDIVLGLELLADDYVTKPFGPRELMARIKNSLRKKTNLSKSYGTIEIADLRISFDTMELYRGDTLIKLTPNEFRILYELYDSAGNVVSREVLMEKALGYRNYLHDRTIDTHIKNIRQKIEQNPHEPKIIITVRELGFRWDLS